MRYQTPHVPAKVSWLCALCAVMGLCSAQHLHLCGEITCGDSQYCKRIDSNDTCVSCPDEFSNNELHDCNSGGIVQDTCQSSCFQNYFDRSCSQSELTDMMNLWRCVTGPDSDMCSCGEEHSDILYNNSCWSSEFDVYVADIYLAGCPQDFCYHMYESDVVQSECYIDTLYEICDATHCKSNLGCVNLLDSYNFSSLDGLSTAINSYRRACTPDCLLGGAVEMNIGCGGVMDPATLDYSGKDNNFHFVTLDGRFNTCGHIELLDLSHNIQTFTPSFERLNIRALGSLEEIDMSWMELQECPDFSLFAGYSTNLRINLSNNTIYDCDRGFLCGLEDIAFIDFSSNRFEGVLNISRWFDCVGTRHHSRARQMGPPIFLQFDFNENLSSVIITGVENLVALSIVGTNAIGILSVAGNCPWRRVVSPPLPRLEFSVSLGLTSVTTLAVDGGTYDDGCRGSVRYRVDRLQLPDCLTLDEYTAELSASGCSVWDINRGPSSIEIVRYNALNVSQQEKCSIVEFEIDTLEVKHRKDVYLVIGKNYSRDENSFRVSENIIVEAECGATFELEPDNACANLTMLDVDEFGALTVHGAIPDKIFSQCSLEIYAVSKCNRELRVEAIEISVIFVDPINVRANSSTVEVTAGVNTFQDAIYSELFFIENFRNTFEYFVDFSGLPGGISAVSKAIGEAIEIKFFGTPFLMDQYNVSLDFTARITNAPGYPIEDRTTIPLLINIQECVDGSGCANDGECYDIDDDPFSWNFTCICDPPYTSNCSKPPTPPVITVDSSSTDNPGDTSTLLIAFGVTGGLIMCVLVLLLFVLLTRRRTRSEKAIGPWRPPPPDRFEKERSMLTLGRLLGSGQFGTVHMGVLRHKDKRGKKTTELTVAVKQCSAENLSTAEKDDFLAEAAIMKPFNHPKVMRLIGVVTQSEPMLIIMDFMARGDLQKYLSSIRLGNRENDVTLQDLHHFCGDVIEGLCYLSENEFVHRDIAARNLLLSITKTVKITDFGLSRKIDSRKDYYKQGGVAMLPVRWMAPEALSDGRFTAASDLWSFGVCMWEVFSGGVIPYSELTNSEVYSQLMRGHRLGQPSLMPDTFYSICLECWSYNIHERPDHDDIQNILQAGLQVAIEQSDNNASVKVDFTGVSSAISDNNENHPDDIMMRSDIANEDCTLRPLPSNQDESIETGQCFSSFEQYNDVGSVNHGFQKENIYSNHPANIIGAAALNNQYLPTGGQSQSSTFYSSFSQSSSPVGNAEAVLSARSNDSPHQLDSHRSQSSVPSPFYSPQFGSPTSYHIQDPASDANLGNIANESDQPVRQTSDAEYVPLGNTGTPTFYSPTQASNA